MCYKEERHKNISIQMEKKLRNVPDFIADFFNRYKSAATKNCNWGYIRDLLQWLIDKKYINKKNICDITTEDMNDITSNQIILYLEDLQYGITRRKNSLDSICTKKNVFSAFWAYMTYNDFVRKNIILNIPAKRFRSEITQKEVKIPTDEQVENFLCRLNDGNSNEFNIIRNLAIVKLIMGSGIRSEELINLDVKDLYLNGGKREDGHITEQPFINILGKGKIEKYDSVHISIEAKNYLLDYLKIREIFVRENEITDNALFLSNEKRRISKTVMTNLFDRYSNGEIYPHMLRHWYGTKLYEKTNEIIKVQKQLRHSSLETAAKYYVHINMDEIADVVAYL